VIFESEFTQTMKLSSYILGVTALSTSATAFVGSPLVTGIKSKSSSSSSSSLSMVLEKPTTKKIAKIEQLKVDSDYLIHPLKEVRYLGDCVIEVITCMHGCNLLLVLTRSGKHRIDDIILSPSYRYLTTK